MNVDEFRMIAWDIVRDIADIEFAVDEDLLEDDSHNPCIGELKPERQGGIPVLVLCSAPI